MPRSIFSRPVDFGADRPPPRHLPRVTPAAARAAVVTLRGRAVSWARSYGLPQAAAEDVAHDALELLLVRSAVVEPAACVAWLRAVVLKKARCHGRKHHELVSSDLIEDIAREVGDPEDTLASAQLSAAVQAALSRVSSTRRPLVIGVLAEGRTLAAVAREEQIPESAARRRLADGTADLRGALSRERVAERRRTGGFSSFAAMLGIDVRWGWLAPGLGALAVGGALLHIPPTLAPTPDELPARAFVAVAVEQATALPRAERGAERVSPAAPRKAHDAGARMLAARLARR